MKQLYIALPNSPDKFLRIKIDLEGCHSSRPYFSITGETKDTCGCIHDEILKQRPELKSLVDIHLSDMDGKPCHAEENGFYWLAKVAGIPMKYGPNQGEAECLTIFKSHCRIKQDDTADFIVEHIKKAYQEGGQAKAREEWGELCKGMGRRWKREATAAIKLYNSLDWEEKKG